MVGKLADAGDYGGKERQKRCVFSLDKKLGRESASVDPGLIGEDEG